MAPPSEPQSLFLGDSGNLQLSGGRRQSIQRSWHRYAEVFPGVPRVCIIEDAIPFVGKGRNVIQGYVSGADPHLIPGQPCLVVDARGKLVAHGTPLATPLEMAFLRKGIAVKVRDGAMRDGK